MSALIFKGCEPHIFKVLGYIGAFLHTEILHSVGASVKIGEERVALTPGVTQIGQLKFDAVLENKAENFYSWVVYLENASEEKSPRIREFLGLDMKLPAAGAVKPGSTLIAPTLTAPAVIPFKKSLREILIAIAFFLSL